MTALALFIVTFVIHPPTPKKEGNHIHPLILFPALNSFTNEQQIIYTASNWQPPVLLSLSLPHKIIHSILLAQTFFFPLCGSVFGLQSVSCIAATIGAALV